MLLFISHSYYCIVCKGDVLMYLLNESGPPGALHKYRESDNNNSLDQSAAK